MPGFQPRSFLHGLPSYIHTVHEEQYFTQFIIPIDRDHLYSMCAMSGKHTKRTRRWWTFYYPIFCVTHDTLFIGQDHRVLRETKLGRERLSAWDQDLIRWRKFAVENARGYNQGREAASNGHDDLAQNGSIAAPSNGHAAATEALSVSASDDPLPVGMDV